MKAATRLSALATMLLVSHLSFGEPGSFDIVISRDRVVGNLVYGTISLNGKELGSAYENNDLKISAGSFAAHIRYESSKNHVLGAYGLIGKTGDFLIQLDGLPDPIQLHQGNRPWHSKGCILLGPSYTGPAGGRIVDENHPLVKLRRAFYGTDDPDASPDLIITVTVIDNLPNRTKEAASDEVTPSDPQLLIGSWVQGKDEQEVQRTDLPWYVQFSSDGTFATGFKDSGNPAKGTYIITGKNQMTMKGQEDDSPVALKWSIIGGTLKFHYENGKDDFYQRMHSPAQF